ncbi:MAG TPA: aldose 1-epimerase [Verrucomicrobiae bacterium]|jgi:aldose 1-epimerase|nr:aldose 1-epimerase [Verrucomicrobiae bacterium]
MELITLRAGGVGLTVAPAAGGAVTRYWLERDGATWEWLRPTITEAVRDHLPYLASAFPLVPYSNRIREGRFTFHDRAVALPRNRPPERHAIHGHGWQSAWRPVHVGPTEARLEYHHAASEWPYRATQHFTLTPASLTVALTLTNEGDGPMPAGLGWHPYFPRTPRTTITADVRAVWLTDDEVMPTALASPTAPADPSRGVAVDTVALDNCFVGWNHRATIEWPESGASLAMTARPPLDYLVIFSPPGRSFFCAEPVSHVTDAFNLAHAGRADTGRQVIDPGATLEAAITLTPRG